MSASKWKPYPKYEPFNEILGLDRIPSHWKVKKLKHIAEIRNGQDQKLVLDDNGEYPIYGSGGVFGRATKFLYSKESVLLGRKGTIDKPLFVKEPFWTVDTMFYTEIQNQHDPQYFYYLCLTIPFKMIETNTALPSMAQKDLKEIKFSVPEKAEQIKISTFLLEEIKKIENIIFTNSQIINSLEEKRSLLITQAVTKGLNPNAVMKDSGLDWLGEVPEHWKTKKVKHLFQLTNEPSTTSHGMELLSIYTAIGVRPRKSLEQKGNKATSTDGYWLVKKEDLIVNKLLAWMGAIGRSEYDGVTSPAYDILRPLSNTVSEYYHFLFRCGICLPEFKKRSRGIMEMRLRLYFEELGSIEVPYPPPEEQQEIADYIRGLDDKQIDMESALNRQIELFKEYQKALISAVVTGKIDVNESV